VLGWQVRSRLQSEVIHPWIGGAKLAARRGMTGITGNIYAGLHEFADMMFVLHLLRKDDLFFDVGANVGSYTVLASGVRGARTWAFEPDPGTVAALARNVEINQLGLRVAIYELAVGSSTGAAAFTVGQDTVNHVASAGETDVRTVRMDTLDNLAQGAEPLMMKVDVEGFETEVLAGAKSLLAQPSLRALCLETLEPSVEAELARLGFERRFYDPHRRMLTMTAGPVPSANALLIRDVGFVEARVRSAAAVRVLGAAI
jgi:FkbM family methyltransferase